MTFVLPEIDVRPNSLAIVGWEEGGAGLVESWIEEAAGWSVPCFIHPEDTPPCVDPVAARRGRATRFFEPPENGGYKGRPLISAANWPDVLRRLGIRRVLVILHDCRERLRMIALARQAGLELVNAIHPTATILAEAILHDNVVLYPRAVIGYRTEIHSGVIVNIGAQIDHHGVLYAGATIDPAVVMAGNVTVETCAKVHTSAVIINRIRIGEEAVVGAGAVVIRDVPPRTTVVGNPARPISPSL